MTRHLSQSLRRQEGMTLLEVMISLTLGLMFLAAALNFLVSGQQSYRAQDVGSRIQENARFAMDMLRENVRLAGFSDDTTVAPAYIYRDDCGSTINGESSVICSDDTATNQGDRLAVSMLSRDAEDCLGTDLGTDLHLANVFWVEQDATTGISSLFCRGYDVDNEVWHSVQQPLVDGIDQMQVQYGVYSATTDAVDRYLNATAVEALTNGWENVQSVRIALLVGAGSNTGDVNVNGTSVDDATFLANYTTFTLLDGAAFSPGDNQIRRVYTSTITINNSL